MNEKKTVEDNPFPKIKNNRQKKKLLGPVPNLEKHVPSDWWRSIFNSLYLKTDADVVEDPNITKQEVDLFSQILNLSPNSNILDLCCGQGRHSLEFAIRGFQYVEGLDRSHYLIQKAKCSAKKEGLNVRFREGDARKLPYTPDVFDVVMILGNSFGYFETTNDDLRVLREVFRVLKPGGNIIIDVADGEFVKEHFQSRTWEWIDKKHFVCRERSLSTDKERLISREVISHSDKGIIADQFYAERLYTKETLGLLFKIAGFSDIAFHGEIATDSQRNQDLGLMERRLIVSARNERQRASVKGEAKNIVEKVAVVFGDPNKKDILKPGTVFDEDDIYTIDQLKSALKDLKGYKFIYLNNHDTLIRDLMELKGHIDYIFNLCDEGFNNDAALELHIPALLEIVGMPYTGAGPQCLAFCYDKSLVRGIAKEMGIPVPKTLFVKPEDNIFEINFGFPVIVKPNFGDGSFGITQKSVANTAEELFNATAEIRETFRYDKPILVEEFLTGKDLSIGIIGNPPDVYKVLPIVEEDYSMLPPELPQICGQEAKWLPQSPYWNIKSVKAEIPENVEKFIVGCCLRLFERLECRDYSRFDWRLDSQGSPKLLEVNPNPGWCWDGHLAKMAKIAGISYVEMLKMILNAIEKRLKCSPR